jgi:hypothetical protein
MNFRVRLTVKIWNEKRTAYFRGQSETSLPFVPIIGMKLCLKGVSDRLVLTEVVWLLEEEVFECRVEPDCVCVFDLDEDVKELTRILDPLQDLTKAGWSGLDRIWRGA